MPERQKIEKGRSPRAWSRSPPPLHHPASRSCLAEKKVLEIPWRATNVFRGPRLVNLLSPIPGSGETCSLIFILCNFDTTLQLFVFGNKSSPTQHNDIISFDSQQKKTTSALSDNSGRFLFSSSYGPNGTTLRYSSSKSIAAAAARHGTQRLQDFLFFRK